MKVLGTITEVISAIFRKDSQQITLRPSQSTTYTANRNVDLPPQDANAVIVSESATQTLTNKSIDADTNTITNIENADIKAGAAIDATKLGNGDVSNTELSLLNGLTSIMTPSSTDTLTNKTIDGDDNTLSNIGISSLKTVLADADKVIRRDAAGAVISGNSLPNSSALVTTDSTSTLSNKTLASPIITTAATLNAEGELRLADSDSSNYVGFKSPATVSSNQIWTLPSADGSANQALTTNGSGVLQFATISGGGSAAYSTPSSNVTLTSASARKQIFDPTTNIDVNLPTTGIVAGDIFELTNLSTTEIIIKASGGSTVYTIRPGTVKLVATTATPTLSTHWGLVEGATTESLQFVPSFGSGFGTISSSAFSYIRRLNKIHVTGYFIPTSLPPATLLEFFLPSGMTIDYSDLPNSLGNHFSVGTLRKLVSGSNTLYLSSTPYLAGDIIADGSADDRLFIGFDVTSYVINKANSAYITSGDVLNVEFTLPIVEFTKS